MNIRFIFTKKFFIKIFILDYNIIKDFIRDKLFFFYEPNKQKLSEGPQQILKGVPRQKS